MLVTDNSLRVFVWTPERGPYRSLPGSAVYVVYREAIYPIDFLPGKSARFRSVEELLAGHYAEAPDLNTARQMLDQIDFGGSARVWHEFFALHTDQNIRQTLDEAQPASVVPIDINRKDMTYVASG